MTKKQQKASKEINSGGKVVDLLEMLVAIELAKLNMPQEAIAKRLRVAKAKVNATLKGAKIAGRKI